MQKRSKNHTQFYTAPSPGWGPRGQGPSKNRQRPGKNYWTDHVPSGLQENFFGILGHFCIKKIEKDQMAALCSMEADIA